jgi:hypothetical protein
MPATTRAKFQVNGIEFSQYGGMKQPTVKLSAVTAQTEPDNPENKAFWSATPQGQVSLTVTNPDAAEIFELGKTYYVDFTPAE